MLAPDGRVVMISGANRGIGLATAKMLSDQGYLLSLGARNPEALAAATVSLPADRVLRCTWEASDNETSKAWVAMTVERFGRIDAVFANAGLSLAANLEEKEKKYKS